MLFVLFQLGRDRYALEAARLAEVLPLVRLKALPLAAPGIAGVLDYRGAPVPVVDLCALALGRPAAHRLGTRLLLVRSAAPEGTPRLLGLIAEQATETLRCPPADFQPAGVASAGAPYLGPVKVSAQGMIQWIEPERLLSPEVKAALYGAVENLRCSTP